MFATPRFAFKTAASTLAATVAAVAMASLAGAATNPVGSTGSAIGAEDSVHCYGVNACKGQSDCKTTAHECKGMNSCKGQGFKQLAAGTCLTRNGTIGDIG